MMTPVRVAAAAVIGVLAIGGALYALGPVGSGVGRPAPTPTASPTPSPSPIALHEGALVAGTYATAPFDSTGGSIGACVTASLQAGCAEDPADDTIRVSFTVPDGWVGTPLAVVESIWIAEGPGAPAGAWLSFERGGWLHAEPCDPTTVTPTVPVGPTVADFANALADHPKLDVTTPVDVTLAGYRGKYVDLMVPDDISACPEAYWPWEPGAYAQGPGNRLHLWILDVRGVRVVIRASDFAATSAQHQAELRAIVDSIQIES